MDCKEDQATPTPTSDPPPSKEMSIHNLPKEKRKKPFGIKIKFTQIQKKPPEPESTPELLLHDSKGQSRSHRKKRVAVNNPDDVAETLERAEEIRANLGGKYSFAKALVRSNVTVGFWMHLPIQFCKMHLPEKDTMIYLEDENGDEYTVNYISERTALSGGWKYFCANLQLVEGDVLIFNLVKPLRFKVYIIRGNSSARVHEDKEFGVLKSVAHDKQTKWEDKPKKRIKIRRKAKHLELFPAGPSEDNNQENRQNPENRLILSETSKEIAGNQPQEDGKDHAPKPTEIVKSSESSAGFEDIKGIESFSISINGLSIDSELSDHHRKQYYELCRSQNSFLHNNLLQSINYKLAVEIIIGTVNISEAIRASQPSNSREDYEVWDKTLKGFELLGMNVGFLRARLDRLMALVTESEEAVEAELRVLQLQQSRASEEIKSIGEKLLLVKEARERLDSEIVALKENAEMHELMFQEVVNNTPW